MAPTMASSICLRCLTRSVNGIETSLGQRAAFSSTPASHAAKAVVPAAKRRKTLKLNKKKRAISGKPPAIGERRASRKRVVLSNPNAVEVENLEEFSKGSLSPEKLNGSLGQVMNLNEKTVDALRGLEAFKHTQAWGLFRRPAILVRKQTAELAKDIARVESAEGETVRRIFHGARGCGKSVLQLQAMAMALQRGWIVAHIPDAFDLVIGHSSYEPVTTAAGTRYIQPQAMTKLLTAFVAGNGKVLAGLNTTQTHPLPLPLNEGSSLSELAEMGLKNNDYAWPVWQAIWTELLKPGRPKVLFTMDAINYVMKDSSYLDRTAQPVHAHDLELVNQFLSFLSGSKKLPNGGIVLAATSGSNRPSTPTFDTCLVEALETGKEKNEELWNPYITHDNRVRETLKGVPVQEVPGLSKEEAKGIMEYYARSGILKDTITDSVVSRAWTLAGGGIFRELERATVRTGLC